MNNECGDVEYWQKRWDRRAIGFHLTRMNPVLETYFETLVGAECSHVALPSSPFHPRAQNAKRFFFPLCGKSIDMPIVASHGHYVTGTEGVLTAIKELSEESDTILTEAPNVSSTISAHFRVFRGKNLEFFVGDFFCWPTYETHSKEQLQTIGACDLYDCVFDRGSLVAITPNLRTKYVQIMDTVLAPGARVLIAALEYDQAEMDGPPYSLSTDSVRELYYSLPDGFKRFTVETLGCPQWITENSSGEQFNRFLKADGGSLSRQRTVAILVTKKY